MQPRRSNSGFQSNQDSRESSIIHPGDVTKTTHGRHFFSLRPRIPELQVRRYDHGLFDCQIRLDQIFLHDVSREFTECAHVPRRSIRENRAGRTGSSAKQNGRMLGQSGDERGPSAEDEAGRFPRI